MACSLFAVKFRFWIVNLCLILPILKLAMKYWCRLGIWVALAAGFYILVNEVLQKYAFYETWRWHIYKILIGVGALLALIGKHFSKPSPAPQKDSGKISFGADNPDQDDTSTPIFSSRYCGFILTTFGVIVRVVIPGDADAIEVAARTEQREKSETSVEVTNKVEQPKPLHVDFPDLRLQGVACSKATPSALINRKTYFVGDIVEGAKVTSIFPDSIVLEKGGEKRVYQLRR
jgi:hypothetical protein